MGISRGMVPRASSLGKHKTKLRRVLGLAMPTT